MELKYSWISSEEFFPLFNLHRTKLFADNLTLSRFETISEEENLRIRELHSVFDNAIILCLVVYHGDELVAWSWGRQETGEKFYMVNSAVYPEYRRQGIYKKMLGMMLEKALGHGFQIIYSQHLATNNSIIIPKLQFGFVITGLESDDQFGLLLKLIYYSNQTRKDVQDFRSGLKNLPQKLKHLLK